MKFEDAVLATVAGDHGDPFSFLGPHRGPEGPVVRAFLPGAKRVEVVSSSGGSLGELERAHPDGLFAGPVSKEDRSYRLRVAYPEAEVELEDPYRFPTTFSDYDLHLLGEGTHLRNYELLGAHLTEVEGVRGVSFAVWAPNARRVSVVGDFNSWDGRRHVMRLHPGVGVWEIFVPGVEEGAMYKYEIKGKAGDLLPLKADPYGFRSQHPPQTASVVHDIERYEWADAEWMDLRGERNALDAPIAIYEVHLGSWRRKEDNRYLTYRELADELPAYVRDMGYTHVEFLPPTEHPFDGSWGYQPLGMFAPTSRFGTPDDFKHLVESLHRAGIGVVMDWVPAHFPEDEHGLALFDGTHLYEHADPRRGRHMDWGTLVFNLGRNEVRNYLLSNALFWLSEYHIDALRVDAVASMLYLDYSREEGEWVPNEYGGNEDLDAVAFIRQLNEVVYDRHPDATTMAEESTAWPMVSRPTYLGGLGFGYKWNMGWMHDTLQYIGEDPIHRSYHHDKLTFGLIYAFNENFILPLSHDEVVHGKGSILGRMPGDEWQRFANLRLYYAFMYGHPGKKLLFMGGEFGQSAEWNHDRSLDWHLLQYDYHRGVQNLVRDLNELYRAEPALHRVDFSPEGFEWVDASDSANSVISFLRKDRDGDFVLVVCNFTPVVRENYRIGAPEAGRYVELLNTDAAGYGGSGVTTGGVEAEPVETHGRPYSLNLTLPPLGAMVLKASGFRQQASGEA
jgi:1,4-alpha-glucan branching enzyme